MTPGIHIRRVSGLTFMLLPLWFIVRGVEFSRDGYGHLVAVHPTSAFRTIWVYTKRG